MFENSKYPTSSTIFVKDPVPILRDYLNNYCQSLENCEDIRNHPDFKNYKPKIQFKLLQARLLKIFMLIAQKFKLKWWVDRGTALGIVRESGMLFHDDDLDVSLPYIF